MSEPQSQLGDVVPHETRRSFPIGWVLSTLEEACVVIQGQSPPGTTYNTNGLGLPFLQGKAEFTDLYPKAVKWCSAPSKIAEPDDVLISIRAPVGPTNLCAVQSCIGRGLAAIRTQGDMPAKYILYAMRATEEDLRANSTGTTFEAIRGNDLRSHPFPLPPLAEQNRIVAEIEKQFTRLDASVAALKRVQANLKRYRASVLKAACDGKLVPTEAELARVRGTRLRTRRPAPIGTRSWRNAAPAGRRRRSTVASTESLLRRIPPTRRSYLKGGCGQRLTNSSWDHRRMVSTSRSHSMETEYQCFG